MKNMKKKALMAASYVAVAALAIGGTLAYLTDSEDDKNTMTVGKVTIEQHEYERVKDAYGNYVTATDEALKATFGNDTYTPDLMQEFTNGQQILPAVYDTIKWDDRNGSQAPSGDGSHQQSWKEVGAPGSNQLFDAEMKNVIDKFVFVENTGSTDAYYRTVIAIESPEGFDSSLIHINANGNSLFDWEDVGTTVIDGVQYYLKVATYNKTLAPGEVSRPSLLQVFLGKEATNEDVEKFGDTFEILVASQAVQVGKGKASEMLDEAFGDITSANHPWSSTAEKQITGGTDVASAVSLDDTLKTGTEGETRMVLNVEGNVSLTTGAGHGSTMLGGENTKEIVLQGNGEDSTLVATGAGVGEIMNPNGRIIFKDMTIIDNSESYAENAWEFTYLEFGGELYFENCNFTSGIQLKNAANATFVNCTFQSEEESVYSVWVSDGTAVFSNCTFTGTRGMKIHEAYGSNVDKVVVDNCVFDQITKKPGIAIGTLDATTVVTITNSTFNKCQAGDQTKYIYETDTDVDSFKFTEADNMVVQ